MIRAVIFDCFGVLTTDGWLAVKERYFAADGQASLQASLLNRQADTGQIKQADYLRELAQLAGVSEQTILDLNSRHSPNDQLFSYIRHNLKNYYRIGLLSNASADWLDELFAPWQVELFEAKTFSFELGVVKPHHLMYETIAAKLDIPISQCLMIDDRENFCLGARDAGMQAIQFKSNPQTITAIEEVLYARAA